METAGDYQLCFDNSFSYQTRKVVFFEIFIFDAQGNVDEMDLAKWSELDSQQKLEQIGITLGDFQVNYSD